MARIFIYILFLLLSFSAVSQNYIGIHKDKIREKVSEELSGFAFSKEVYNGNRSFIKFENRFEEQTLIFMLNTKGYCTAVSRMYNSWLYKSLQKELNEKYGESEILIWEYEKDGQEYTVELNRKKWFVSVITKTKRTN
ncbi:MAG: hypothetical protein R6U65_11240 [Perlabentimonas sp.]